MYCGILTLWRALDDPGRAARAVAILTLVGAVNIPIVKFSVEWWSTLHQGASVLRIGGPLIDPAMLRPLLAMALAFTLLGMALHLAGAKSPSACRRVRTLTLLQAERLERAAA
jgi:heme exporter protein C